MPRKLKVFRTPTGFHDAYVAAPSRKAALEAWGATADLFARGAAEEITDERLMAEALKRPGEVIHVSRGDLAAQLKALGPRKSPGKAQPERAAPAARRKPAKPQPPPRRERLDKAEAALVSVEARHAKERAGLEKQRDALDRKLDTLGARQAKDIARLEAARDQAKAAYRAALDKWSG